MQPLRRYLSVLFVGAILGVAAPARAQGGAGNGIKLGDVALLHVGLGLELDWDSNVFFTAGTAATPTTSAFELRLSPRIDFTNQTREGNREFTFDVHAGLNYLEYLTANDQLRALRQFAVDAGFLLAFFKERPFHFSIFDNYLRSTQPPYQQIAYNIDRDTNELGAHFTLAPGGGRLVFDLGYVFGIDYFEVGGAVPTTLADYDLMYHRFDFRASWKFLPKTAVYIAAAEILYLYQHPGEADHPNSYPLRVDAGIQGLITAKLTINAWVGYGNGFYQYSAAAQNPGMGMTPNTPNPSSVVAGLALGWKPTVLSTGTLGYNHDFVNSLLGSYYDVDQVYASWTQLIWRFTGFIRFSYSNERFKGITAISALTSNTRTDNLIMLNTRVDYPFMRWLWASVGYDLQVDRSDGQLQAGTMAMPGITIPVDYTKHVVYLRLTAWY